MNFNKNNGSGMVKRNVPNAIPSFSIASIIHYKYNGTGLPRSHSIRNMYQPKLNKHWELIVVISFNEMKETSRKITKQQTA